MKKPKHEDLPDGITFTWQKGLKNLPTEDGVYCVLCRSVKRKEEWFSFAEYIPERLPNCKIDFDEWRVLGCTPSSCFARHSADNAFTVIAWAKMKRFKK